MAQGGGPGGPSSEPSSVPWGSHVLVIWSSVSSSVTWGNMKLEKDNPCEVFSAAASIALP